ncbi:glutamine-hydrolyzing carbamoyl-phosphate synthase small subunit [Haloterrigena sp. SYSU A558-1]|uniref:Carbamoyl phosphate synthase small chain n=1 Tax=Haloterrigena gelatinilytica TaxID=2741724 RepID=A0A8J8KB37_9EURY|nr:glutamine-hydrolyzing carbamoyl-phosphate synthase small subunit [Haloterrigena gelatinilytica]NUB90910.1 glutamine-hydrolyzing carbamoyl-phosphate synthase small subunit [Haloterrigena gelatinilytica]NUC73271.1 glutamine-hydrolyzing carbamoyl-phosphate synthase small subunit [Haloterrigena gelatinilytica]
MTEAYVALEDGRVLEGRGRAPGTARGELVFTTAYTGYEESLTDPSYEEQVLTFSYPLIGNYGVREERFEDDRVHPRAALAKEFTEDVAEWLESEGVPAVDHLDTREVVTTIRDGGAMKCGIAVGEDVTEEDAKEQLEACEAMSDHTEIGEQVSVDETEVYGADNDGQTVALVDCGAKGSIVDSLLARDAEVHVLPHDASVADVEAVDPDVLFISNGPGDPVNFEQAIHLVEEFVEDTPVAGICLGQQIVAEALGGTTEKMDFGHRGVNQPVLDLASGQVVMTTQNHGYTVAEPGEHLEVTQINVNDDTPEGIDGIEYDVITRQYHPEANPGPEDTLDFFDDVLAMADSRSEQAVPADD